MEVLGQTVLGHGEAGAEPELPVDPLAASPWPATTLLLGLLSPMTRLPVAPPGEPGAYSQGPRVGAGVDLLQEGHPKPWAPRALSTSEGGVSWESPDSVSAPTLGHPFTQSRTDSDHRGPSLWGGR